MMHLSDYTAYFLFSAKITTQNILYVYKFHRCDKCDRSYFLIDGGYLFGVGARMRVWISGFYTWKLDDELYVSGTIKYSTKKLCIYSFN